MATARLSDSDRSDISDTMLKIIRRSLNNIRSPIIWKEENIGELRALVMSTIPPEFVSYWEKLKTLCQDAVRSNRSVSLEIYNADVVYKVDVSLVSQSVPVYNQYAMREYHPQNQEWVAWAQRFVEHEKRTIRACDIVRKSIPWCTSAGQVKRLFPNAVSLLPDYMKSTFADAVRQSRIPQALGEFTDEKRQAVEEMVALGAVSPVIKDWQEDSNKLTVDRVSNRLS